MECGNTYYLGIRVMRLLVSPSSFCLILGIISICQQQEYVRTLVFLVNLGTRLAGFNKILLLCIMLPG